MANSIPNSGLEYSMYNVRSRLHWDCRDWIREDIGILVAYVPPHLGSACFKGGGWSNFIDNGSDSGIGALDIC